MVWVKPKSALSSVAAIFAADFHFSDRPPAARAAEADWLKTQAGYLKQVRRLCEKYACPLIGAGDWFDDGWRAGRCSPALISMVLRNLPTRTYGIPGQHDLPHHRLDRWRDSAFGVLVEAGKLAYLQPDQPVEVEGKAPLRLWGFPWGHTLTPLSNPCDFFLEVAVVHAYVWVKGRGHAQAPADSRFKNLKPRFRGYDAAVVGDNHTPWEIEGGGKGFPAVFNCGGFVRRRADEANHRPRVGLLYGNGTVESYYLNISGDKLDAGAPDTASEAPPPEGLAELVAELKRNTDKGLDFPRAVKRWLDAHWVDNEVRERVLESLGNSPCK